MPAIKLKKAAAEHQAEKEREERERGEAEDVVGTKTASPSKPKESSNLLKGLDPNILFEKRKRTVPPAEQKLLEWVESNLEKKEGCKVSLNQLYDLFGEACTFDGTPVVDQTFFNKKILEKYGKEFALTESSSYKGLIKEKKAGQEKGQKVKADSLKLKMKDIIEEVLKEAGNPSKGLRFHTLKQCIAGNYPALRVDLRPGTLKNALERGVRFGYVQLVRGVGQAGYYRLPTDEEPDEDEDKTAEGGESRVQNGDAEAGTETADDVKPKAKAKGKAKSHKKKAAKEGEGDADGEGDKEKGEVVEGEEGTDKEVEGEKKKKKKKPKRRAHKKDSYHSAPQRIEDTFALAMTYMCEPKRASFGKIKKYFAEFYPHIDAENDLKAALLSGEKKGYWERVSGTGISGSFQLLIDEFDPNSTDNIHDMICSSLIACNEPKQASAQLLKKYIIEYHPEFKVESRPHLYKGALERAVKKQMVIQLTGLGATGSYQMWSPFTPSPALLAGEDESEVEDYRYDEGKEEVYIPRGTKSRSLTARKPPPERTMEAKPRPKKKRKLSSKPAAAGKSKTPARGGKKFYAEDDDDEEEEEEEKEEEQQEEEEEEPDYSEPKPKKVRKSPAKKGKAAKKTKERPVSRAKLSEEVSTKSSSRKSKSRSKPAEEDDEEEAPVKKSQRKSKAQKSYAEDEDISDEEATPKRKSKAKRDPGSGRRSSKVNYNEKEADDEEEEVNLVEYTPRKSKSRGGENEETPTKSASKRGKKNH